MKAGMFMRRTGIVKKVDELGRIVLPVELRRMLDIAFQDELEIFVDGQAIILQKFEPTCIFCGADQGVIQFRGKSLCENCLRDISEMR